METGIVQEEYDYYSYPEVKDESNWKEFRDKKIRQIKALRLFDGNRIVVYNVETISMFDTGLSTVRASFGVDYKIIK